MSAAHPNCSIRYCRRIVKNYPKPSKSFRDTHKVDYNTWRNQIGDARRDALHDAQKTVRNLYDKAKDVRGHRRLPEADERDRNSVNLRLHGVWIELAWKVILHWMPAPKWDLRLVVEAIHDLEEAEEGVRQLAGLIAAQRRLQQNIVRTELKHIDALGSAAGTGQGAAKGARDRAHAIERRDYWAKELEDMLKVEKLQNDSSWCLHKKRGTITRGGGWPSGSSWTASDKKKVEQRVLKKDEPRWHKAEWVKKCKEALNDAQAEYKFVLENDPERGDNPKFKARLKRKANKVQDKKVTLAIAEEKQKELIHREFQEAVKPQWLREIELRIKRLNQIECHCIARYSGQRENLREKGEPPEEASYDWFRPLEKCETIKMWTDFVKSVDDVDKYEGELSTLRSLRLTSQPAMAQSADPTVAAAPVPSLTYGISFNLECRVLNGNLQLWRKCEPFWTAYTKIQKNKEFWIQLCKTLGIINYREAWAVLQSTWTGYLGPIGRAEHYHATPIALKDSSRCTTWLVEEWRDGRDKTLYAQDCPPGWVAVHIKSKIFEAVPQMDMLPLQIIQQALNALRDQLQIGTHGEPHTYVHIGVKNGEFTDQRIVNLGAFAYAFEPELSLIVPPWRFPGSSDTKSIRAEALISKKRTVKAALDSIYASDTKGIIKLLNHDKPGQVAVPSMSVNFGKIYMHRRGGGMFADNLKRRIIFQHMEGTFNTKDVGLWLFLMLNIVGVVMEMPDPYRTLIYKKLEEYGEDVENGGLEELNGRELGQKLKRLRGLIRSVIGTERMKTYDFPDDWYLQRFKKAYPDHVHKVNGLH